MFGPEEGIWKTEDGGNTWEDVNEALPSLEINGLGLSPDDGAHRSLLAASNDGILLSEDTGGTWRTITPDPAQLVTISPNGRIIAAAFYGEGLRFSDDLGETWQNLPGPWDSVGGKMLALAVTNLHYYYIAHQEGMGETMTLWQGKLGRFEKVLSEPAGENPHVTFWFPSGPATDRPWYASLGNQVWKVSGRSGGTHSHSSVSSESAFSETILSLTGMQDPLDQILLFACTGQYIYKSQDARTWVRVHDFGDDRAVAIHLSSAFLVNRTVYALLLGGVFCRLKL
jgi:hypothetical protein